MTTYHAKYKGPVLDLRNCKALVRPCPTRSQGVLAQFDDRTTTLNGVKLGWGWHRFPARDFKRLGGAGPGYSQSHRRCLDREWRVRVKRAYAKRERSRKLLETYTHHREVPRVGTLPGQERR